MASTMKNYARRLPGIREVIAERDRLRQERDWLLAERYASQAALARVADERDRLYTTFVDRAERAEPSVDTRHLVVVTYGRSGSTLLQGVLNSIPGYLIRGENRQVALRLLQYHLAALSDRDKLRRELELRTFELPDLSWSAGMAVPDPADGQPPVSDATRPWFGIEGYDETVAYACFRNLLAATVLRPAADTRVSGYKEVRWPADGLVPFLEFLQNVFPGCRFIVNTRDLGSVLQSKWWADDPAAELKLRQTEAAMVEAASALGDDAIHIRYDDWATSPAALAPLFDWLGEKFDETRMAQVLGERHSY